MKVSTGKSKSAKSKGAKSKSGGAFPSASQLAGQYKADARRAQASARRETADAQHRTKEAQHYQQEAKKAQKEGYTAQAKYDLAKARRETAEARRDQAKARKNEVKAKLDKAKAARAKAGLVSPGAIGDRWILGGNDWHNGCAAVALANHLYATTGIRASDEDVLGLYWLTADDPGEGAGVAATLEVAAEFGLGGIRLAEFRMKELHDDRIAESVFVVDSAMYDQGFQVSDDHAAIGAPHDASLILDLRLQRAQRHQPVWDTEPSPDWGAHAGVLAGGSVITWGREIPVTPAFLERQTVAAWQIEWGHER